MGNAFCSSCGARLTSAGAGPVAGELGLEGRKSLTPEVVRLARYAVLAALTLAAVLGLFVLSAPLYLLLVGSAVAAILALRRTKGTQTSLERRVFGWADRYGGSAWRAYEEGKHWEFARNAYEGSKRAYEETSARYRDWAEAHTVEWERTKLLKKIEGERERRRAEFGRYGRFFERARDGSGDLLGRWQEHESRKADGERPPVSGLLRSAWNRAETGLEGVRGAEASFVEMLQQDLFGDADRLLDGLRAGQEDPEGGTSVLAPLAAARDVVKRSQGGAGCGRALEELMRDLEDILDFPATMSATAEGAWAPGPGGVRDPGTGGVSPVGPRETPDPGRGSSDPTENARSTPQEHVARLAFQFKQKAEVARMMRNSGALEGWQEDRLLDIAQDADAERAFLEDTARMYESLTEHEALNDVAARVLPRAEQKLKRIGNEMLEITKTKPRPTPAPRPIAKGDPNFRPTPPRPVFDAIVSFCLIMAVFFIAIFGFIALAATVLD